ncbi:hypothetical protein D3C84_742840 [compost metagenome]
MLLCLELDKREQKIIEKEKQLSIANDKLNDEELYRSNLVEYNSQTYASFYNTRMEKDKSLLTLSIATLGFIITYMSSALETLFQTLLISLASGFLLYTSHIIIKIFDKNADYLIACTQSTSEPETQRQTLEKLDKKATRSFYCGILLTIVLAFISQQKKETDMTTKDQQKSTNTLELIKESFSGAFNIKPQAPKENAKEPSKEEKK